MFIEEIINFILQNFVFFLILLFGLSRFFSRTISSSEKSKEFERNPLPPVAKPFFNENVERLDEQKFETSHEQLEKIEKVEETPIVEFNKSELQRTYGFSHEEEQENNENNPLAFNPAKNELINAVIWSEILGPPRAYKKHMFRR